MRAIDTMIDEWRRRRETLQRNLKLLVLAGVLVFVCSSLVPALMSHGELASRRAELRAELQVLQAQKQKMLDEAEALEQDPFYIERVIRNEMNMMAPGEYRLEVGGTPEEPATESAE